MELEHLISREASWSAILSGIAGANIPLLHTLLEILSKNGSGYNSNDINYYASPWMWYHIDGEVLAEEALRLMPPNQSPHSHVAYLQEKEDHLWAWQVDLEVIEAEVECQR